MAAPPENGTPPRTGPRRWGWQEASAVAAALVVGVLLGPWVLHASQPLPFISVGGRVVAIGRLADALMQQASGPAEGAYSIIGTSFRNADGDYCRTFSISPGPAGLACREWGEWVVEVLARNPRARQAGGGAFMQAGTAWPEEIRAAVQSRIAGEALPAAEESALIARHWRSP